MTNAREVLLDGFGRVAETVFAVLDGADREVLDHRPGSRANTVAWLVWHLTRVQDDHVSEVAGAEQVWLAGQWQTRFGLPLDPADTGYGHDAEQVALVRADAASLQGYHDAVQEQTTQFLHSISDDDLDRVVDESWDPPVTLAVRLVSVIADGLQHGGQAAYVRGLVSGG